MMSKLSAEGIPEERVAAILARAAELDRSRRETVTVEALRTAAVDAGISLSAVDAALEEYAAGAVIEEPLIRAEADGKSRFGRLRRLLRKLAGPAKLGAIAFVLGLAGGAGEGVFILGIGALLFMSGRLVLRHRPSRKVAGFGLAVVVMTLGLAAGFGVAGVDEDVIAGLFAMAVPVLVVGALAIKVRVPRRSTANEVEAPAG